VPERSPSRLFNASGRARELRASPLFAIGPSAPGPAIRRGFLLSVPIGVALIVELGFNAPTQGAIAAGAVINGFPGMDAPAKPRAGWQGATAPLIGLAACLGVLSSQTAPTAVLALGLLGLLAGYCFAVSLRLAIVGLSVTLGMLIAQGLFLETSDALPALLWATVGGLSQAVWSLIVWLAIDKAVDQPEKAWDRRAAIAALRANLTHSSPSARHGIRFGAALAAGVAAYLVLGFHQHGYWIPLTILFVMRADRGETDKRLILRALGTALGLVLATSIGEAFAGDDLVLGIVLTIAAALSLGLLTVQYALFTAAITTFVVLMSTTVGEGALNAAGQRATGTLLGIAIAFLAWRLWPNPGGAVDLAGQPNVGGVSS
jgi:hypothetical protein